MFKNLLQRFCLYVDEQLHLYSLKMPFYLMFEQNSDWENTYAYSHIVFNDIYFSDKGSLLYYHFWLPVLVSAKITSAYIYGFVWELRFLFSVYFHSYLFFYYHGIGE